MFVGWCCLWLSPTCWPVTSVSGRRSSERSSRTPSSTLPSSLYSQCCSFTWWWSRKWWLCKSLATCIYICVLLLVDKTIVSYTCRFVDNCLVFLETIIVSCACRFADNNKTVSDSYVCARSWSHVLIGLLTIVLACRQLLSRVHVPASFETVFPSTVIVFISPLPEPTFPTC